MFKLKVTLHHRQIRMFHVHGECAQLPSTYSTKMHSFFLNIQWTRAQWISVWGLTALHLYNQWKCTVSFRVLGEYAQFPSAYSAKAHSFLSHIQWWHQSSTNKFISFKACYYLKMEGGQTIGPETNQEQFLTYIYIFLAWQKILRIHWMSFKLFKCILFPLPIPWIAWFLW